MNILTEEELNACENTLGANYWAMQASLEKVIASHRQLLSANAELSFKNMKYKKALHEIEKVNTNYFEDDANLVIKIAKDALEELKNDNSTNGIGSFNPYKPTSRDSK